MTEAAGDLSSPPSDRPDSGCAIDGGSPELRGDCGLPPGSVAVGESVYRVAELDVVAGVAAELLVQFESGIVRAVAIAEAQYGIDVLVVDAPRVDAVRRRTVDGATPRVVVATCPHRHRPHEGEGADRGEDDGHGDRDRGEPMPDAVRPAES